MIFRTKILIYEGFDILQEREDKNMNVDPKQIESLINTFCEMNDEFREKAVAAVNKVFLDYVTSMACMKKGILVTKENQADVISEITKLLETITAMTETQQATTAIFIEHLEPGSFTEESNLEIKINQKKITLNQFIKRVLPNADIKEAKKMYKELNMDKR